MPVCTQSSHDSGANEKLAKILSELEKITAELGLDDEIHEAFNGNFYLFRRGKMFWWKKIDDASSYRLKLFIKGWPVACIELDRNTRYYTFKDIEGFGIFNIRLEAENHDGEIIGEVDMYF